MSKNVAIVFSIPKAKSGSIFIKIRPPFFWTDPYLPGLVPMKHRNPMMLLAILKIRIFFTERDK